MAGRSAALCCCLWLLAATLGPCVVRAFLQPLTAPPAPAAAGSRAWLPPAREAAALASLGTGRRRPWRSPFLQASPALAAEPATAAAGGASGGESGGPAGGPLEGVGKEALFVALESHMRRKEAFEILWNSELEFTEAEYQELLKACFRLGYGALRGLFRARARVWFESRAAGS